MDKNEQKEIRDAENIIKLQNKRTTMSKRAFIKEMNRGLGSEIQTDLKSRPRKPNMIRRFIDKVFNIF